MAQCPFCGSRVTEDLVVYGGTCPKCFAEIPGEEAATDPGEEVRAAQDRRDRLRARIPVFAGMLLLVTIVACTGLTAVATVLWPEPEVAEILDFDALDLPMPDLVGADELARPAPQPRPSAVSPPSAPEPVAVGQRPRPKPVPSAEVPREANGTVSLSLGAPAVRRDDNVVLSDPDAIRDMIGERMVEFIPGLKVCYDRRLKVSPTLRGRWLVKFTVATSGAVQDVSATALDKADAELERCLAEHVRERWRFGQITLAQPVRRTLRFYPN